MRLVRWILGLVRNDALLLHTSLLFVATVMTSVCNVGFQMVVSRVLPESEYTLLATFLALIAIISRPLSTLTSAVSHYASLLNNEGRSGAVGRLVFRWSACMALPSVLICFLTVLFSSQIAAFFHLERSAPVVLVALALPGLFVAPVLSGAVMGLQKFGWVSASSIANALGRVLFGAAFVMLIAPACGWGLAGHVGGLYVSVVVLVCALWKPLIDRVSDLEALPSLGGYLYQSFFIQISAAVLMTADVVLVQRLLPEEKAFAYAATLARMVAFMAVAVATAMFPKVSSGDGFSAGHRRLYFRSQLYTAVFVGGSMVLCFLMPELLLRILFKVQDADATLIFQTRCMALVMGAATLLNTNISLLLAQKRFSLCFIVVGMAVVYVLGAYLFHRSVGLIMLLAGLTNLIALVVTTLGIMRIKCVEGRS